MHTAGARAVREDDNEMSREAVLLQWERKIEVAERLDAAAQDEDSAGLVQPVPLRPADEAEQPRPRTRRFERRAPEHSAPEHSAPPERSSPAPSTAPAPAAQAVAERRTVTITGRPTPAPARRRRAVVDSQL